MKQLYYTHAYPHLISNISIWGSQRNTKTYLQPLIKMQKKIIRLITNLPPKNTHRTTYKTTSNPKLMQFVHTPSASKCTRLSTPQNTLTGLNTTTTTYRQLTSMTIKHATHTTNISTVHQVLVNYFTGTCIKVWNSLPAHIRNISSKAKFKKGNKSLPTQPT